MVYEQISDRADTQTLEKQGTALISKIAFNKEAIKTEDSKRECTRLEEETRTLILEKRKVDGAIVAAREEVFKDLLAEEYDFPRTHPKFNRVYSYAYSEGHSSGYSEIENKFSDLVELFKD